MRKIIYHLRGQPEHVKRNILHGLTVVFGIVLIFAWIYSLGTNLSSVETQEKMTQDLKPFSVLKDNLALPQW